MPEERMWSIIIAVIFSAIWVIGAAIEARYGKDRILSRHARAIIGLLVGSQWFLMFIVMILGPWKELNNPYILEILFDVLLPVLLGIPIIFLLLEGLIYKIKDK